MFVLRPLVNKVPAPAARARPPRHLISTTLELGPAAELKGTSTGGLPGIPNPPYPTGKRTRFLRSRHEPGGTAVTAEQGHKA